MGTGRGPRIPRTIGHGEEHRCTELVSINGGGGLARARPTDMRHGGWGRSRKHANNAVWCIGMAVANETHFHRRIVGPDSLTRRDIRQREQRAPRQKLLPSKCLYSSYDQRQSLFTDAAGRIGEPWKFQRFRFRADLGGLAAHLGCDGGAETSSYLLSNGTHVSVHVNRNATRL